MRAPPIARARLTLALAAVVLGACTPEKTRDPPRALEPVLPALPFNPFAHAEPGDWTTTTVRTGEGKREAPGLALRTYRVASVEGDDVTVEMETVLASGKRSAPVTFAFSKS